MDNPGFCIDTGAPTSVIGLPELRRIFAKDKLKYLQLRKSPKKFKFADAVFQSLGRVDLPLATPSGIPPIYISLDVV